MGVDTWYGFGSAVNEQAIVTLTNDVVADGLQAAGYRYVWLDGGWWHGARDAGGNLAVDPAQWPHGMAWLAAYIHAKGLLAGIYTDAGSSGCGGGSEGSYGHYQQDVDAFAAWGFDAVKLDNCGGTAMQADPRLLYEQFAQAIAQDSPRRSLLLNVCNPLEPGQWDGTSPSFANSAFDNWSWAPALATSWRVSYDIGNPGDVRFSGVLHNLAAATAHPDVVTAGHFADPDYLVPGQGRRVTEAQSQFSMWAMVAAPMMLSANPATLSAPLLRMVTNPEAIAISQDPTGVPGKLVASGAAQTWVKPLAAGERAVAFFNPSSRPAHAEIGAPALGFRGGRWIVTRDVWAHRTTLAGPTIAVDVPVHATVLLRIAAVG